MKELTLSAPTPQNIQKHSNNSSLDHFVGLALKELTVIHKTN